MSWTQVKTLLQATLELPPEARAAFLASHAAAEAVKAEVRELLAAHEQGNSVLDGDVAALLEDAGDEPLPPRVGPYRPVAVLGRGGMGVVYLAERAEGGFAQRVALKIMRQGLRGGDARARFERERAILARLEHPRIARLSDGGVSQDGLPWFALELVEGDPVTRWCDAAACHCGLVSSCC